jgi:hypothetical protein
VLFRTAAELLRADVPLVLEGNFSDRDLFARLPPARIVQLVLEAPAELLLERYLGRAGRHPGHHTEGYADEIRARLEAGEWRPLDLPGPLIRIDTTAPVDLHAVAKWIIAP